MPGLKTLAVVVTVKGGARWEAEDRSGWSHLLEHLVFKGAGDMGAREIVERVEAEGGSINAATGYERTSFQVRALKGGLDLGSAVIADLVQRPTMDAGDLAREIQVVGQEIAEAADTPDDHVFEMAQDAAFHGQPLGRPILGTDESIGRADPSALSAWRSALYAPDALVICASGAVDENELLALAERDFGAAAGQGACEPAAAAFVGGVRTTPKALEQANLVFLLPAVGVRSEAYFALRLYAEILGGGMASRLFQEAREKRGLAYAIDAFHWPFSDCGVFGIGAGTAPEDVGDLVEVALDCLAQAARDVSEAEVARARAQMKVGLLASLESPGGKLEQMARQVLVFGRAIPREELARRLDAVSLADVRAAGQALLDGVVTVAAVGPLDDLAPVAALRAMLARAA